nr:MAG TPA: hypothetical protein [Caudoviricetes sp.]
MRRNAYKAKLPADCPILNVFKPLPFIVTDSVLVLRL